MALFGKKSFFVNKFVNKSLQFRGLGGFGFKGCSTSTVSLGIRILNTES